MKGDKYVRPVGLKFDSGGNLAIGAVCESSFGHLFGWASERGTSPKATGDKPDYFLL